MKAVLSVLKSFRDGLSERPGLSGLTIAILAILLVARVMLWATGKTGPSIPASGTVERIYVANENLNGAHYAATVRLSSGAQVTVQFGSTLPCDVGDVIHLTRSPTLLGVAYTADFAPCSPAPSAQTPRTPLPARPSLIPS